MRLSSPAITVALALLGCTRVAEPRPQASPGPPAEAPPNASPASAFVPGSCDPFWDAIYDPATRDPVAIASANAPTRTVAVQANRSGACAGFHVNVRPPTVTSVAEPYGCIIARPDLNSRFIVQDDARAVIKVAAPDGAVLFEMSGTFVVDLGDGYLTAGLKGPVRRYDLEGNERPIQPLPRGTIVAGSGGRLAFAELDNYAGVIRVSWVDAAGSVSTPRVVATIPPADASGSGAGRVLVVTANNARTAFVLAWGASVPDSTTDVIHYAIADFEGNVGPAGELSETPLPRFPGFEAVAAQDGGFFVRDSSSAQWLYAVSADGRVTAAPGWLRARRTYDLTALSGAPGYVAVPRNPVAPVALLSSEGDECATFSFDDELPACSPGRAVAGADGSLVRLSPRDVQTPDARTCTQIWWPALFHR